MRAFRTAKRCSWRSTKTSSVKALERIRIAGKSAGEDPAAQARAMIGAYYANLPDSPACSRVYVVEAFNVSPAAKEVWKFWRRSLGDLFARAWSRGGPQALPELRTAVASAIIQIAIDWIEDGFSRPVQSVIDTAMQISSLLHTPRTALMISPAGERPPRSFRPCAAAPADIRVRPEPVSARPGPTIAWRLCQISRRSAVGRNGGWRACYYDGARREGRCSTTDFFAAGASW